MININTFIFSIMFLSKQKKRELLHVLKTVMEILTHGKIYI